MPKLPLEGGRRYVNYLKHVKEERCQGRYLAGPATNKSELVKDMATDNTRQ